MKTLLAYLSVWAIIKSPENFWLVAFLATWLVLYVCFVLWRQWGVLMHVWSNGKAKGYKSPEACNTFKMEMYTKLQNRLAFVKQQQYEERQKNAKLRYMLATTSKSLHPANPMCERINKVLEETKPL